MIQAYVRGRQYELIALRELAEKELLSNQVLPVVEPVKLTATLVKTMEAFANTSQQLGIICNPAVGSFASELQDASKGTHLQAYEKSLNDNSIMKSLIIKEDSKKVLSSWREKYDIQTSDWLTICTNRDFIDLYKEAFSDDSPRYVLIPDNFRRKIREHRVLFEDRFNKCNRNVDYLNNEDEFFSDDHLYYEEDGYTGFGDYSVIGGDYFGSGFAPYAVAIHIVYFDGNKSLRVHHFVSESNEDIQDPAKKYYEAVKKIAEWDKLDKVYQTTGLKEFLQHFKDESYPGLGTVKKLSLMHHLELMSKYLDGEI